MVTKPVVDCVVREIRPGEWEWSVKFDGQPMFGGNAYSAKEALASIVAAVNPRLTVWQRLRRWLGGGKGE